MASTTDTFTGANGTALDTYNASWVFIAGDGHDYYGLTNSGTSAGPLFGSAARIIYRSTHQTYANDQYSEGTIENIQFSGSAFLTGFLVRVSADTGAGADYYQLEFADDAVSGGTHSWTIDKVVNGSLTNLTSGTTSLTNADLIRLEITGTTLSAKKNTVQFGTTTDASLSAGNAGISGKGSSSIRLALWGGGDLGGSAFTPNKRKLLLGVG